MRGVHRSTAILSVHRVLSAGLCAFGAGTVLISLVLSESLALSLMPRLAAVCFGLFLVTVLVLVAYPSARQCRGYLAALVLLIAGSMINLSASLGG